MSNSVRYDPLLVRYLADELNERLEGRAIAAVPYFAGDRSATLALDRGEQLRIDLHPERGWIRILPDPDPSDDLDALCTGVSAPPDERLLRIDLNATGRFRDQHRSLFVELHTNQWNALLTGEEDRIISVLRSRRARDRVLFPGEVYIPPAGEVRYGADLGLEKEEARQHWISELADLDALQRKERLLTGFAWTGIPNVAWILGPVDHAFDADAAFSRWWWLRSMPPGRPGVLTLQGRVQPYPLCLRGIPGESATSLLDAMARVAEEEPARPPDNRLADARSLAQARLAAAERRLRRLEEETVASGEADRLKAIGDLLLARLHQVPSSADSVSLEGWDGEAVEITLDPELSPAANAARYYDRAGRRKRAEERLPGLIDAARKEQDRWRVALREIEEGEVPASVTALLEARTARAPKGSGWVASLPYRVYRTSGGLEVRVGRTARDNDRLTFHASAPNDVWLHAQSVPGSHVILRWPDPEGAPPARDLNEAAQLAAYFSRARTSGTVAVDWTRRKYVRKPRGAAPGAVIPQRVRTLFVAPDASLAERLAVQTD